MTPIARVLLVFLAVAGAPRARAAGEPLSVAAEFFFSRHDFRQALQLWGEVLKRQPDSVGALYRVSELKLMFEGRPAVEEVLSKFLDTKGTAVSAETRKLLKDKLGELQSTFLSDEGQSVFFQALPKVTAKDCPGAIDLLTQAATLEKGNLRVLREKAKCEKSLGLFERYFETLRLAYDIDPYDGETLDNLAEAYVFYRAYDKAAALFRRDPDAGRTVRQKIAFAVALAETGQGGEALPIFQGVLEGDKLQSRFHPIVFEGVGRLLSSRGSSISESIHFLERFLTSAAHPANNLVDGWDPYHTAERIDSARKLVALLKTPPLE